MSAAPTPVTILTGYLGAGKTTLLNRLLAGDHGRRIAVIENEVGAIGVDAELVIATEENVTLLSNGCLCCTVRDDLQEALGRLAGRADEIDQVVIETSGLADVGPVLQTFHADPAVRERFEATGVVALVDARHFGLHLERSHELREQVAFADLVLLNKVDLVDDATIATVEAELRRVNPLAQLHRTRRAAVAAELVLSPGRRAGEERVEFDRELFEASGPHRHEDGVAAIAVDVPGALDPILAYRWLGDLIMFKWAELFRLKGELAIEGLEERVIVQGVHMSVELTEGKPWAGEEPRTRLVLIGRELDREAVAGGLRRCLAGVSPSTNRSLA